MTQANTVVQRMAGVLGLALAVFLLGVNCSQGAKYSQVSGAVLFMRSSSIFERIVGELAWVWIAVKF